MFVRKLAGLAIAAGVLVSVAGCSFNPNPESLQSYAPSDGVGADLNFPKAERNEAVKVRNLLVVTDGTTSSLFGTIINSGNKAEDVTLQLASDSTKSETVKVLAGDTFVFDANHPTTLPLDGKAGSVIDIQVGAGAGKIWSTVSVPVLDGTIDYYQNLLTPSVTPSPTN